MVDVPKSKANLAYEQLKEEIMSGQLLPGDWLVERQIAQRLGMSKTPVREALAQLKNEQMIRSCDGGSMQVASWSVDDFLDMYEVREVLEGFATRLTVERHPLEARDRLETIMQNMCDAADEDWVRFYGLNLAFHAVFKELCDNSLLAQELEALYNGNRFLFGNALSRLLMRNKIGGPGTLSEHRAIVDAVGRGDGDGAEQVAREHVRNTCERILGQRRKDASIFAGASRGIRNRT